MMMVLAAALLAAPTTPPDGARLRAGGQCFTITRAGLPTGLTWQTIRATRTGGRATWDIVVHQRANDGRFDLRDHFVVDRKTLRPMSLESVRGVEPSAPGWRRVSIRYAADRITGIKETKDGVVSIDTPLDHTVWDGNLWGLTFAAMPLRPGANATLPFWQYDKGFGAFTVKVVGRERAAVPDGSVDAWILEAGDDPAALVRYVVSVKRPMEIGYSAGPFAQRLGGDCASLAGGASGPKSPSGSR
jgi:hypothetical protein